MSKVIAFFVTIFTCFTFCTAQESKYPLKPDGSSSLHLVPLPDSINLLGPDIIRKGQITMPDSVEIQFSDLKLINNSVVFFQSGKEVSVLPLATIRGITKTKSNPGTGALIGGLAGMAGGLLLGGIVNPRRTTEEWINDQIDGEEEVQEIRREDLPYMAIGTAVGAAIGALVGLSIKKSTVVYFNNKKVDVFPALVFAPGEYPAMLITVKFNID